MKTAVLLLCFCLRHMTVMDGQIPPPPSPPNVQPAHMPYAISICSEPCNITSASVPGVIFQRGSLSTWSIPAVVSLPIVSTYVYKPVPPGSNQAMPRPADTFYVQQQSAAYTVIFKTGGVRQVKKIPALP